MGKKKRNKNGQVVKVIRVKKNAAGYEQPRRSHSTSSEETQPANLFDGYGAVDLNETEQAKPETRKPHENAGPVSQKLGSVERPKGLTNLGNTCYFNSVLQVLSQTCLLRQLLAQTSPDGCEWEAIHFKNLHPDIGMESKEKEDEKGVDDSSPPDNLTVSLPPAFEIFTSFTDSLRDVRTGHGTVFTPNRLLNCLGRKSWQFRGREQQDSHELLRMLLDLIKTDEIRRKRKAVLNSLGVNDARNVDDDTKAIIKSYAASCNFTAIDALFGGYILSTVKCEECESTSQIFEQFYDLSLPVSEGKQSFQQHNQQQSKSHTRRGWNKETALVPATTPTPLQEPDQPIAKRSSETEATTVSMDNKPNVGINNKNKKQVRAEKKAAKRAEKELRLKQSSLVKDEEKRKGIRILKVKDDDHEDERALEQNEQQQQEVSLAGNSPDSDDFEIGDMVPLFSDLGVTDQVKEKMIQQEAQKQRNQTNADSTLRIDMSYSVDASHKNLDVRLKIATSDECNVSLAIDHKRRGGSKSTSFECNLKAAQSDAQSKLSLDPASESSSDEYKDRKSSLSGEKGDMEDEAIDEDGNGSDAASSTRAMIDDQDLDDQLNLLSLDDIACESDLIEESKVSREEFDDLEPPDVMDDDGDDDDDFSALPKFESPADQVTAAATSSTISVSREVTHDLVKPAPSPTTDEVIRRIRSTSESVAAMKHKVNWSLKTVASHSCESHDTPSIESCLSVFTFPELLTGSNKLSCENCSEKEASATGAKESRVFANASKQMLIAYPPIILTLHLKRFYAEGYGHMHLRKINRHVRFPFTLDMSPWVSQMYKKMGSEMGVNEDAAGTRLSYKLYGLVQHSGTLRSGHYTAMICVRRREDAKALRSKYLRLKPFVSSVESFLDSLRDLDHDDHRVVVNNDDSSMSCNNGSVNNDHLCTEDEERKRVGRHDTKCANSSNGQKDTGSSSNEQQQDDHQEDDKWFYVSDSHVAPATRESVLNSQAYILFYERL